jgi:hypothetical protein
MGCVSVGHQLDALRSPAQTIPPLLSFRCIGDDVAWRLQLTTAMRSSFEAHHGISGYPRSPAYHMLRGAVINPLYSRELADDSEVALRMKRMASKKASWLCGYVHGCALAWRVTWWAATRD